MPWRALHRRFAAPCGCCLRAALKAKFNAPKCTKIKTTYTAGPDIRRCIVPALAVVNEAAYLKQGYKKTIYSYLFVLFEEKIISSETA